MKVLFDLVMDDLKACPEDTATREMVTDFMLKAANHTSMMAPLVLTWAWRMKDDSLFRAAVRAGFRNGVPEAGVIQALVKIVKDSPAGPIDWDKRCVPLRGSQWLCQNAETN